MALSCGLSASLTIVARPLLRNEWSEWSPWPSRSSDGDRAVRRNAPGGFTLAVSWLLTLGVIALFCRSLVVLLAGPSLDTVDGLSAIWTWVSLIWIAVIIVLASLIPCGKTEASFRWAKPVVIMLVSTLFLPIFAALLTMAEPIFASKNSRILVADVFEPRNDKVLAIEPYFPDRKVHWASQLTAYFGVEPFLDITGKVISSRPSNWSDAPEAQDDMLDNVVGADLEGEDLRSLDANRAFLVRANLHGAQLDFANLRNANLRGADLREAHLRGTILRNANLRDAWMWKTDLTRALLGGDDPFEPNQEGKVNVQGARLEGVVCAPERLREARNYALAYYGIRNGLEILRYREFSHFEELERLGNDLAYKSAVDNLRKEPDRENVDSEYLSALETLLKSSDVTKPEKNAKTAKFLKDIQIFISRNANNRGVLRSLKLGFRTDEQLLLGQLPNYNFDGMNLREADLRKFQLTTASFERAVLRDAVLHDADLRHANFTDADLRGADFQRARLDSANFLRQAPRCESRRGRLEVCAESHDRSEAFSHRGCRQEIALTDDQYAQPVKDAKASPDPRATIQTVLILSPAWSRMAKAGWGDDFTQ